MPTTARAARIHEYGPPEVLRFEDIVVGEPGDDEALIRNTVIGLNFVDVYYRRGTLPVPAFPAIIGDEAAGVVEAVGKNVKNVSVGDRVVYGDIAFGAYATARLHPADRLVRIPAGVSDAQAASTFLKGLTARFLLKEVLELRPGDTVLYHAAAGGVGQIFVQWAKALGLKVIGTVSSDAKAKIDLVVLDGDSRISVVVCLGQDHTITAEHDTAEVPPLVRSDAVAEIDILSDVLCIEYPQLLGLTVPRAVLEQDRAAGKRQDDMWVFILTERFTTEHDCWVIVLERAQDGAEGRFAATVLPENEGELLEGHIPAGRRRTKAAHRTNVFYLMQRHLRPAGLDTHANRSQPYRVPSLSLFASIDFRPRSGFVLFLWESRPLARHIT
jgi:hypothetical protein